MLRAPVALFGSLHGGNLGDALAICAPAFPFGTNAVTPLPVTLSIPLYRRSVSVVDSSGVI